MKVYIDGAFHEQADAKISVFDHGVLYGDGIFEGLRAYGGRIFRLEEHLRRLQQSAEAIFLKLPMPPREIGEAVIETVRVNALKDAYIRLVVTRGVGDLGLDMRKCRTGAGLFIIADHIELYPEGAAEKGLTVITSSIRQRSPDQLSPAIKSLNYLANVLARAEAARAGAQEAILLNREGFVSECTGDNIFFVYDGAVYTPPLRAGILEGVTRGTVLELCRDELNNPVVERLFSPAELTRAQEVFLTGTGAEIVAATAIDGHKIGSGSPGPVTRKIIELFRRLAASTGTPVY